MWWRSYSGPAALGRPAALTADFIGPGAVVVDVGINRITDREKAVRLFRNAKDKLDANYPDCKHEFPPEVREVAYRWLDRWLQNAPGKN